MNINTGQIYNWKRTWKECKSSSLENENQNNPEFVDFTLEQLTSEQCLILLGDAALGKSVCLIQEEKRLEKLKIPCLLINLKSISGEQWLTEKFEELNRLLKNNEKVYFLVDSFDEGMLTSKNLVDIFTDKLKKVELSRLYLRIACRTVVFPQYLYDEIYKLRIRTENYKFKPHKFNFNIAEINRVSMNDELIIKEEFYKAKIYKLQPLSKQDIDLVLNENNIDSEEFYKKVPLQGELTTPITAKYIVEEYPNLLKLSKYEIYKNVCLKLSNEYNGSINKMSLNSQERTNIASIVATLMTFSNKYAISYKINEIEFTDPDALYLQKYLSDFKNVIDLLKLSLPQGNLEEVLNTGLFTGENEKVYFIQKTYQEFLTADFLFRNNLYSSFKNLFFDEYNKVLPFFANTISWLADKDISVFNELLEKDPETLMTSIVQFSDLTLQKKILSRFFEVYEKGFDGRFSHYEFACKINISKDDFLEIVKPCLYSNNSYLISQAITFLNYRNYSDYKDRIMEIALSDKYDFDCRMDAIYFLRNLNLEKELKTLSKHLINFQVEDIGQRSKFTYSLLNILLPNNITSEEVSLIFEQQYDQSFYLHLNPDLISQNKEIHQLFLTKLMQLYLEESFVHETFQDSLFNKLINNLSYDNDPDFFCDFLFKIREFMTVYDKGNIIQKTLSKMDRRDKQKIFNNYFLNYLDKNNEEIKYWAYRSFFNKKDTIFLLKMYFRVRNVQTKKLIIDSFLTCSVFSPLTNLYYRSKDFWSNIFTEIFTALKKKEITYNEYRLKSIFDNLCDIYESGRTFLYYVTSFILKKRPMDRVNRIIKNMDNQPKEEDWANLLYALSYLREYKELKEYGLEVVPIDIKKMQGYGKLSAKQKQKMPQIAAFYLENHIVENSKKIERLTQHTIHLFQDLLLVPAMFLIYENNKVALKNLMENNQLIEKSLSFLIDYPYYGNDEKLKENRKDLVEYLFNTKTDVFIQELSKMIDIILSDSKDTYFNLLNDLNEIDNKGLNEMLLDKCKNITLTEVNESGLALFSHIINYLITKEDINIKEFLKNTTVDASSDNMLRASCAYYLSSFPDSLKFYIDTLKNNEDFAKKYFKKIAEKSFIDGHLGLSEQNYLMLDEIELAQLYIALENYYPSSDDEYPNGIVTPRQQISILKDNIVNKAIKEGYLEFFNYLKVNSTIIVKEFNISRAKRNKTQKSYLFLSIENLLTLILNKQKRIIFDSKHLFEVILETLDIIAKKIRNHTTYMRIWNEVGGNVFPKSENALSDEISRELKNLLPNIIINREVEIKPLIAGSGSQRTDILVQCPSLTGLPASVIIEVKGCWNQSLRTSIKTQLCDDYLCDDNNFRYGVYLIGWYCCSKWNAEDKTKRMSRISVKDRFSDTDIEEIQSFFQQQETELSKENRVIKSVVLDCSIPN